MSNSMKIKDKLKHISNKNNLDFNIVLRNYMYERFIERLAKSIYKEKFILKGGYFLSIIYGLNYRHTMDIDLSLKNKKLTKDNVLEMINEICKLDINDGAEIVVDNIKEIRQEDKYGGYRIKLIVKIENIKERFNIDIATGDVITPKEIIFKYRTMFDYKYISLKAYNLETIIAEKLETILSRKELNSRIKDFYDIYLIYTLSKKGINKEKLLLAIHNTFKKRNFVGYISDSLEIIKNSAVLEKKWKSYIKQNKKLDNIEYKCIVNCLSDIIKLINLIEV